ncbi:MAG TPA: hypothetical protein VHW01_23040 [Polyangiaceae bacterium]|jgi:hypothetical protein|nr:hypothetical protein [Polyangiaceae bacterium]
MTRAKSKPSIPKASKPQASKPKASKPKASKPVASKPKGSKPVAAKPVAAKPVAAKPVAARAVPAKVASKPEAAKPLPSEALVAKPSASKPEAAKLKAAKAPVGKAAKPAPPLVRLDTPAMIRPIEQAVGVSSDAVARRTGKSWAQWFQLLDAAGAAELDHKGIVAVLAQRHGVGPWWQQMVTSAYEQARGKRETVAADEGFQVDIVKTLELPLAKLFRFWSEPAERNKWLADDRFSIHKATASKSIRARWGRGVSRIDVDFCEKGPMKSQVTVQHNKIESSDAAEQMKAYWAKKISALEALLTRD